MNDHALSLLLRAWRISIIASSIAAILGLFGVAFVSEFNQNRQVGLTLHPIDLGSFLVPALGWFVLLAFEPAEGKYGSLSTIGRIASLALLVIAVAATGSLTVGIAGVLGGLTAVAVATILTRSPRKRRRRSPLRALSLVAAGFLGLGVLFTSDTPATERFQAYLGGRDYIHSSAEARGDRNSIVLEEAEAYILVGTGPEYANNNPNDDTRVTRREGYIAVHNTFLKVLYEYGLPALIGLWILLISTGVQAYRLAMVTRGTHLHNAALGIFGAFVATNVISMFSPTVYARHYWLPIALINGLSVVVLSQANSQRRHTPGPP